jgi:hypothetical protein
MSNIYTNAEVTLSDLSPEALAWLTTQCENESDAPGFDPELAAEILESTGSPGMVCDEFQDHGDGSVTISVHEVPTDRLSAMLCRYLSLFAPDGYVGVTYSIEGGGPPTGGAFIVTSEGVTSSPTPEEWLDDNVPSGKTKVNE